jgi:hypothetical protein
MMPESQTKFYNLMLGSTNVGHYTTTEGALARVREGMSNGEADYIDYTVYELTVPETGNFISTTNKFNVRLVLIDG